MRQAITISLPESVKKELDSVVAQEHLNRSDVVREALRRYFAAREFQRLRGLMTAEAEKRGIFTDEDVFKALR
jgi:metal-responsive CopG/Arc/MetJ family transcriptional regulator